MKTVALICVFLIFLSQGSSAQNAYDIVKKSDELFRGKQSYAEITMTIITPRWRRSIGMKVWSLEPDYALVYVTEPAKDKGTVTLKRKNEVWNWLPSIQRVIKIPPSMMLQSWMGSDFTNDDLVKQSSLVEDYTHTLVGEETINDMKCWKIQSLPKPEAAVVWGKLLLWISQSGYQQVKAEFYDEDGNLSRTFLGSNLQQFDGKWLLSRWEMIPESEKGKKTILEYHTLTFSVSLNPSFFSEKNMKTIR